MRDAQKPDHTTLSTLVDRLRDGRFVIPDFQRDFEWKPWDIRDLMRSIFLDYYIGSLLLWKGTDENFDALACEPIYGFEGDSLSNRQHIVLDGQQRLTAMYYTFIAPDVPVPNRSNRYLYFIRVDRFMSEDFDEAFDYDWTKRTHSLLDDERLQWEKHIFPLAIVGRGGWDLGNWVQGYENHWKEKLDEAVSKADEDAASEAKRYAEDAYAFGELLRGITQQYQVAFIELDKELESYRTLFESGGLVSTDTAAEKAEDWLHVVELARLIIDTIALRSEKFGPLDAGGLQLLLADDPTAEPASTDDFQAILDTFSGPLVSVLMGNARDGYYLTTTAAVAKFRLETLGRKLFGERRFEDET